MRRAALLLLITFGGAAFAQVRADGAVTGELRWVPRTASADAASALRFDLSREYQGLWSISGSLVGLVGGNVAGLSFLDLGSNVRFVITPRCWSPANEIFFDLFPFDTRRVRSTFDFADYWGSEPRLASGLAPVLRAGVRWEWLQVWAALRVHQVFNDLKQQTELAYGGMLGAGFGVGAGFFLDFIASTFQRGVIPALADQGIERRVVASGFTGRVHWETGGGVLQPLDLLTYANDPERYERFEVHERYDAAFAAWLGVEGGVVTQPLADPDHFGQVVSKPDGYLDAQARVRIRELRLFGTLRWQSFGFTRFDIPGVAPFSALPAGSETLDGIAAYLGADYRLGPLTPGVLLRVGRPPAFKSPSSLGGNNPPPGFTGSRFVVLEQNGGQETLPTGAKPFATWGVKATVRYEPVDFVTLLLELDYDVNPNRTTFASTGNPEPSYGEAGTFSAKLVAQARF